MKEKFIFFSLLAILLGTSSCSTKMPEEVKLAYEELPQTLNFNKDIKPILSDKCFACHGPDNGKIKGGLQLHTFEKATAELTESKGKYAIVPGSPNKSEAIRRILSKDPNEVMPTPESHLSLTDDEKATLIKWVEEGAHYEPHWGFMALKTSDVPKGLKNWGYNDIDKYVGERLKQEKLTPNEEADKETLLRRVSLDLTGISPTIEEINQFVNDKSPDAYEKQVDRLLNSKHYGEKMATDWMDVARYADTHGYQIDRPRDMSPWRDWVIASFNNNMSYDQFITYQLAGDLFPNPTQEQILATGFNRLHPQNAEGGIVDEEFRVEYVADRTAVLGQGLMGLTLACARCHDHKYDPISQKNYYEFYSFFNNINETGQISWDPDDIPVPTMMLPTKDQEEVIAYLKKLCDDKELHQKQVIAQETPLAKKWVENNGYQKISKKTLYKSRVAEFKLNNSLVNSKTGKKAKMDRQFSYNEVASYTDGKFGKGVLLNGDAWIDLKPVGIYDRNDPFSISLWVNITKDLKEGVIFHKNQAVMLHSMKGYTLYLKDGKLQTILAHTWPENAIINNSKNDIPRDEWVHLCMTNDGRSKANGISLYINGEKTEMEVEKDNLTKSIIFHDYEDIIYAHPIEKGLQIGARWRGLGLKNSKVDQIDVFSKMLTPLEVKQLYSPSSFDQLLAKNHTELTQDDRQLLVDYFIHEESDNYQKAEQEYLTEKKKLDFTLDTVQEVMVMKEMETPRQAYILERGVYDNYGEKVYPNTPSSILTFSDELPKNRLGLARWLTDPKHPLTARVAVNRYWQNFFGQGIVETTEDFGNQGKLPSHPKLLDYLANSFIDNGWDIKKLNKMIVMSSTYRQSSLCSDEMREKDPDNVLLARGPQFRLTSEMMRDNALMASNLLIKEVGGKSVHPYQPDGLWVMNGGKYQQGQGSELYRRSLYTIWKRTVPNPTQATFDQPDRSECTVRRQKTNTPLQALVLLNDPTYIEACRKLGEEIALHDKLDVGIKKTYKKLTGKNISDKELSILMGVHTKEKERFENYPDKTKGWLTMGHYQVDDKLSKSTVVANAIVASVILNSDATITRR
ncbi:DUF1553 domain-containing protein [Flammeovirga sp. MY04]|uniref:DUF1553 domain-containing protein n=1 Tax=Flammeovirga sp. MY04 TaxID=1191459 RepID=UPI0008063413|nr:DUF1553 domain-containing protein [Flammeovirga sp. MY04]ANQ49989.1 DUF1553 domain-containing protein [Flammeovirga sp. MY04]